VFASHRTSAIHSVHVAGHARVQQARHAAQPGAAQGLVAARNQLLKERP
jgi:formimidoylglutamate deiminase